jgi:hypothetical protein
MTRRQVVSSQAAKQPRSRWHRIGGGGRGHAGGLGGPGIVRPLATRDKRVGVVAIADRIDMTPSTAMRATGHKE